MGKMSLTLSASTFSPAKWVKEFCLLPLQKKWDFPHIWDSGRVKIYLHAPKKGSAPKYLLTMWVVPLWDPDPCHPEGFLTAVIDLKLVPLLFLYHFVDSCFIAFSDMFLVTIIYFYVSFCHFILSSLTCRRLWFPAQCLAHRWCSITAW